MLHIIFHTRILDSGVGRRGGNISVDFSMFVLLYNTKFMNNLNLIFFIIKNITLTIRSHYNLQNDPTFHSEERWVNLLHYVSKD